MTEDIKLRHGTTEWFEMIGELMSEAVAKAGLSPQHNVSLVERYTDGTELSDGLYQGIRFDIVNGKPSYRVGARIGEEADIKVLVTSEAARTLNLLLSTDPDYPATQERFQETGEWAVEGDLSRLGDWLADVHDPIVKRTG